VQKRQSCTIWANGSVRSVKMNNKDKQEMLDGLRKALRVVEREMCNDDRSLEYYHYLEVQVDLLRVLEKVRGLE